MVARSILKVLAKRKAKETKDADADAAKNAFEAINKARIKDYESGAKLHKKSLLKKDK